MHNFAVANLLDAEHAPSFHREKFHFGANGLLLSLIVMAPLS
jgi:hypothetical protein